MTMADPLRPDWATISRWVDARIAAGHLPATFASPTPPPAEQDAEDSARVAAGLIGTGPNARE